MRHQQCVGVLRHTARSLMKFSDRLLGNISKKTGVTEMQVSIILNNIGYE